jgi:hypothetical protein
MIKVEEGYTFNYFFYSLPLIALGLFMLSIHFSITIFFFIPAIGLLFDKTGTCFDKENRKIGRYSSLLGNTTTNWTDIKNYNKAVLSFEFINQKMNSRGTSVTSRIKSFELKFSNNEGNSNLFHTYTNYKIAKEVMYILNTEFDLETIDKYLETQKAALKRRKKSK